MKAKLVKEDLSKTPIKVELSGDDDFFIGKTFRVLSKELQNVRGTDEFLAPDIETAVKAIVNSLPYYSLPYTSPNIFPYVKKELLRTAPEHFYEDEIEDLEDRVRNSPEEAETSVLVLINDDDFISCYSED